jgi:predicted Zn-dependent peptidase
VAEAALEKILSQLQQDGVTEKELQKVKNKTESAIAFEDMSIMARANSLAFYELLGDAALFNTDRERYFQLTREDMLSFSRKIFRKGNDTTLHYLSSN